MLINLIPFGEFWIDCAFNANFSILTSLDKSYRNAALLNSYTYAIVEAGTSFDNLINYVKLEPAYDQLYLTQSIISIQPVNLKDSNNLLDSLKFVLKENYFFLGVDLYNWIPNSLCWQKYHWEHYSLIKGYDEEKDVFIVFDSDMSGYCEHEIPSARLEKAALDCSFEISGYVISFNPEPGEYNLEKQSVIENAERLITEIEDSFARLWKFSDYDIQEAYMFDLMAVFTNEISERQIANKKLIEELINLNLIGDTSLIRDFNELKLGWEKIKNLFNRGNLTRKLDCANLDALKNDLFTKEMDIWERLVAILSKRKKPR